MKIKRGELIFFIIIFIDDETFTFIFYAVLSRAFYIVLFLEDY